MAYVTLSFLIQFPSRLDLTLKKNAKFKGSPTKPQIPDLGEYKDLIDPSNFVFPSKPKNYCHIYYLITPFRVVHVSIMELEDVAVIGTKDHKAAVRTVKLHGGTWVAFSVVHKIAMPSDAKEILGIYNHKIEFQISQEAKDLLPEVLKDRTKLFISAKTAKEDEYIFEELKRFENETIVWSNFKESLDYLAQTEVELEDVSVVLRPIPCEAHFDDIARRLGELEILAMSDESMREPWMRQSGMGRSQADIDREKKRKHCKQIRSKKKLDDILLFTGHQLLYDKRSWKVEKHEVTKDIQTLSLWCYTNNLLSEDLRKEMIPFGIYIQKLMNLPKELSLDSRIVISYSLGEILKNVEIKSKQIGEDRAIFNDVKLFFLKGITTEALFSSLQTTPLIIKALESNEICEHFDALRVHEIVTPSETGTVEEGKFVSYDTYLKVKLQISGQPSLNSPEMKDLFNDTLRRIVVITQEYKPLKRVVKLNSDVLKNKNYTYPWKPFWHVRKTGQLTVPENYPSVQCALTGFVVRMSSMNLLVAEGIGGLSFPSAFEDIFVLPTSEGRVMYNSKIIFPERLYNDFLPFGGMYMVDMKTTTIEIIIARMRQSLLGRNFPPLALKALAKLNCLVHCSNIQKASLNNYFPSVQELVSFEHEFGVPAMKKCEEFPINKFET